MLRHFGFHALLTGRLAILGVVLLGLSTTVGAKSVAGLPADPLQSVMWSSMAKRYFADGPIVFDSRVKVMVPHSAENQFFVPVTVDATALDNVEKIVILTDLNPIAHVLTYKPTDAKPFIGLRVKVEQTTPVRAGVKTADGTWHLGGAIVQAAGGGCTAPAAAHANKNWFRTLGQTRVMVHRNEDHAARVTVRMRHPMDTGLAFGFSAFFLNEITVRGTDNQELAALTLSEPVSENPTLTILPRVAAGAQSLRVDARDNDGNRFGYSIAVPAKLRAD